MTLSLADARRVIAAGERRAHQLGQPMNIAVVDEGGNLISHVRMDGAWVGSVDVSIDKAVTARAAGARSAAARVLDLAAAGAHTESLNGAGHLHDHGGHGNGGHGNRSHGHADDEYVGHAYGQGDDHHRYYADGYADGYVDDAPMPAGGVPLRRAGWVVGAVGVSGGSPGQDQAVADAAVAAY
ncbi:heme-binding protein [Frankia sp. CNm7]|uniref:Heme-binding protein n=1 Tax=Frankia nepalensis TaxID=1836974 RepID=A0A937RHG3_9ACTN|nr:heme-binding protein [Frankia nepalensis]MBL7499448.1 heme-binding protein [Frankia nepalensis]MBL7511863.1 heme-binding protein [Frankia nepalensis]MBL7524361.1 heme-binding protein [Frankia nepalensis]MBL7629035.1 heme-binding protein [Frankia nepalensis]